MNKTELIKAVAKNSGENEILVRKILNVLFDTIKESLWYGLDVKIKDFLHFTLHVKKESLKRHFRAKEPILVPKHYYVKVTLPKNFKDKIKTKTVH